MSGHRAPTAPTVTRRNGVFFRPDQPAYPRRPRHQRRHGQAGSWVCAAVLPSRWPPLAAARPTRGVATPYPATAAVWQHVSAGDWASYAATVSCRLEHGPDARTARTPASPAPAAGASDASQPMPGTRSGCNAISGPGTDDPGVPAAVAPGHRHRMDPWPRITLPFGSGDSSVDGIPIWGGSSPSSANNGEIAAMCYHGAARWRTPGPRTWPRPPAGSLGLPGWRPRAGRRASDPADRAASAARRCPGQRHCYRARLAFQSPDEPSRFGVNGDRALVADRRALNVQFWFVLQMAYLSEEDGSARRRN